MIQAQVAFKGAVKGGESNGAQKLEEDSMAGHMEVTLGRQNGRKSGGVIPGCREQVGLIEAKRCSLGGRGK